MAQCGHCVVQGGQCGQCEGHPHLWGLFGVPPPTPQLTSPLVGRQKSSFLPSYIIDVRELDEKLLNIIDMQFLCGYYEPTLLILFEPNQTWPG